MQWPAASLRSCCSIDFCESQLGSAGVRTRLRVGSTTGLRDEPLNAALSQKRYEQMPGASVEWVQMPRDMNAVAAMLTAGLMDLAAIYSEDVVVQLATGNPGLRLCGMFQAVPRRWCCLVPPGFPKDALKTLKSVMIAIPSGGVGPKLMVTVLRERLGFAAASVKCAHYDDLNAAIRSLLKGGKVCAILWEISYLERSRAKAWCDIIDEFVMPWPTHLLVAHKETLFAKLCTIRYFMCFTNLFLQDFQTDTGGESLEYFRRSYPDLRVSEVQTWLDNATWSCGTDVEIAALEAPLELLMRVDMVPSSLRFRPGRHLARGVRLRNSAVPYCQAPLSTVAVCLAGAPDPTEEDLEEDASSIEDMGGDEDDTLEDPTMPPDREGTALCVPDSRYHNLIARCGDPCTTQAAARVAAVAPGEKMPQLWPRAAGSTDCPGHRPAPAG
mmetsp:Transcript_52212/g.162063  ORF Transcript_52212/g.162063 Transcript_52212/m.162063 type:complete len:441 (+) Transcript_52212:55-1377(+)